MFWAGFIFRPLGGVVIGAYADRAGRRAAMMLTIALITIGTMGLALIPSYATIGVAAPILLVVCRVIQGFALGGEVGPASVFLVEAAPTGKRAFYGSWQLASQGIAVMAAGLLGVVLTLALSKQQIADWGWRVPFILCLALIPVALFLRNAMPETLDHAASRKGQAQESVWTHWRYIVLFILTIIGGTVATYVGNYMSTYAIATLKLPPTLAQSATLIVGLSILIFSLLGGALADRFGRKVMVIVPRIVLAIVIWPLFLWLSSAPGAATLYIASIAVSGLNALSSGGGLVMLPELLPKSRARHRLRDRLCGRRLDLRRLDAARHHLADRRHRKSDLARLVRRRDQHRHHRRDAVHPGDEGPQRELKVTVSWIPTERARSPERSCSRAISEAAFSRRHAMIRPPPGCTPPHRGAKIISAIAADESDLLTAAHRRVARRRGSCGGGGGGLAG